MSLALDVLRTTTFDRAKTWGDLNPQERRRRAILAVRDQDAETLWALTEAYLTLHGSSGTAISPRTLKAYRWAVNRYLTYARTQAINLLRASSSDGVRFVRAVEAEELSASSTRVQLAGVRLFYAALRWADATQAAPFNDVKPVRDKTAAWDKRSPYTHDEVRALLEHADARMQALILLCAHGGLRISEALSIRREDINLDGRELTVRHGKGGKQRRVVIGETVIRALNRIPEQPGSLIRGSYPAAVERLRRLCLRAGVAYRGYHALRHYAGTRLTREGATLDDVARHLGHSVLETARIYAKWSDDSLRKRVGQW